jgi:hypothetical protein
MTDHGDVTTTPTAAPAPERRRGRFSVRDVALSMGVLIVPIFVVILGFQFLGADPVARVDPAEAYGRAESAGGFAVLRAEGLPEEWVTTAAASQLDKGVTTLRVGLVAPSGKFARFAQSDRPVARMVADELGGTPRSTGAVELGGQVWLRYPGRGQEQALVSVRPDSVVIVTGTAEDAELRALAASLR